MKVIEHFEKAKNPLISVEIIPPKRGADIQKIYRAVESIKPFNPPFIDVTSHAAEAIMEEMPDGTYKRRVKRKSPGTFGLCAAIKYKFDIDPVPHILCSGFSREETEDALIELNYLGIENLLAIRGDSKTSKPLSGNRTANVYASDLVGQINNMNQGKYLDQLIDSAPTNFCVGVSYYPEKHFEAPNLDFDISKVLLKQNLGAHYGVSQMFFDNQKYFDYVNRAKEVGITIPLIPGLKILTSKRHLHSIPSIFHVDLPVELTERISAAKTREEIIEVGVDWAYKQTIELLEFGVPCVHFYIMQNTSPFLKLMERLKKHL